MDIRVLAYENLRRITGGKTELYRPEREPDRQKRPILEWQRNLDEGTIVYKTLPSPVPKSPPAAPKKAAPANDSDPAPKDPFE